MDDPSKAADRFERWAVRLLGLALASVGASVAGQFRLVGAAGVLVGLTVFLFPRQARDVSEGLVNFG